MTVDWSSAVSCFWCPVPAENLIRRERLPVLDYDVSTDGRQVVMSTTDREGKLRLWVARFDRSSSPVQIPNVDGGSPRFGPGGDIVFRGLEGTSTFVYRVHPDGTLEEPVFLLHPVSPDGRWISAWAGCQPSPQQLEKPSRPSGVVISQISC